MAYKGQAIFGIKHNNVCIKHKNKSTTQRKQNKKTFF